MASSKYKLGQFIERSTGNNRLLTYGEELIVGVTSEGVFSSPKGNVNGVDLQPYKIVRNGDFVYNPSRFDLGSIAYRTEGLCIVSHLYQVFHLNEEGKNMIDPIWLFIYLRRDEFKREITFRNFGSQRPEFNFNDLSEIELPLPSLEKQKKYVALYQAAYDNLKAYETRLDSLKLVCDGYIDKLEKSTKVEKIGKYLSLCSETNMVGKYSVDDVRVISVDKTFIETKANMQGVSLLTYKLVKPRDFAYVADTSRRGDKIALALNTSNSTLLVSSIYTVFRVNDVDILLSDYLAMFFHRPEFDRYARYCSWGSARETFDWDEMCNVQIPIPSIDIQRDIVNIYQCYLERRQIADQMREKIKNLCPVLIRGSLQE